MPSSNIKPRPAHWQLYEKGAYKELGLSWRQKTKRLNLVLLGSALVALLGPFIPNRQRHYHIATTSEEYIHKLPFGAFIALIILLEAINTYLVKSERNRRPGYRLVGQFPVQGRMEMLGKQWLELPLDDIHRVGVPADFYHEINKGDVVEVVYSASEDFVSVRKIGPPPTTL